MVNVSYTSHHCLCLQKTSKLGDTAIPAASKWLSYQRYIRGEHQIHIKFFKRGEHFKVYKSSKFCYSKIWIFFNSSPGLCLGVFPVALDEELSAQITQEKVVGEACCTLHQQAGHLASPPCERLSKARFPTKENAGLVSVPTLHGVDHLSKGELPAFS